MRRAAVYIESSATGVLGGAQTHAAVLAAWLSDRFAVDILVRTPGLGFDLARLAAASSTDLSSVRLRVLSNINDAAEVSASGKYDLFVAFVHDLPPVCPAPRGLLFVLFPLVDRALLWPWSHSGEASSGRWRVALREAFHERRWRKRFMGYQIQTANSGFTRRWTSRRWGIDCEVIYPPVDIHVDAVHKTSSILSVGRFAGAGVNKNQREMLQTYAQLQRHPQWPAAWTYHCAGALADDANSQTYYSSCLSEALGSRVELHANVDQVRLRQLYAQGRIFWHAAGLDRDESTHPQLAEHFGMVTVEAMANGCVPVVIRRGGQSEIVRHGENGFLCESLEELKAYSLQLVLDTALMERLASQARDSVVTFSRTAFLQRMDALFRRQGW